MVYLDTALLARLYLEDSGFEIVREMASSETLSSAWHAQAELLSVFHRAFREGRLEADGYAAVRNQYHHDNQRGGFHWLGLCDATLNRFNDALGKAGADSFIRSADGLHLACAAENGYDKVYSNDRHLLAAAPLFGIKGENPLV